jgi:hypothetical protein
MALLDTTGGCAILESAQKKCGYFFLAALAAGFLAAFLGAGFFLAGTEFTSVPCWGLLFASHSRHVRAGWPVFFIFFSTGAFSLRNVAGHGW